MPEPHESNDVWLFQRELSQLTDDELSQAVRRHSPSQNPRSPRTVAEVLAMGDWLNQCSDRDRLHETMQLANLSVSYVHQRRWLSDRIGANHLLRSRENIPFGHLRALACIPGLEERVDLEDLIEGIQSGRLKVRDLLDRLERNCAEPECGSSLLSAAGIMSDQVVMIVLGRHRDARQPEQDRDRQRRYFCSVGCAHAFLERMLTD